jgi:hypothetical protein
MLKKHLTFLFLLAMAVSTFAQSIPSGTGRFEALGYNPFILDAATDINRNPAWSTWYRNYAFGDIGRQVTGDENQSEESTSNEFWLLESYAGVNFGITKQINLGAVLNKEEGQVFGGSFRNYYTNLGLNAPIVPTEILFGWMTANKKFSVGVAPYYASRSTDYTANLTATSSGATLTYDSTFDGSTRIFGGTVGVVGKLKDGLWEANVDVRLNKFKREATLHIHYTDPTPTTYDSTANLLDENDGGLELNAMARAFLMVSKPAKVSVVPYVTFGMFNWDPKITITTTPTPTVFNVPQPKNKWLNIGGGVGINMPILDDGLLAGGLSFGLTTEEVNGSTTYNPTDTTVTDTKTTSMTFPRFNVGGEWKFTDWLTGRMGYSRGIIRSKVEVTTKVTSVTNNGTATETTEANVDSDTPYDQTITVGLGWHFGRFSLDGLVGERFVQRGPNILSGKKNDLFGVVSASYNFNK